MASVLKSGVRAILEHNLRGALKEKSEAEALRQWIYGDKPDLRPADKRWSEYTAVPGSLRLHPRIRLSTLLILTSARLKDHPDAEELYQEPLIIALLDLAKRHAHRFGEDEKDIIKLDPGEPKGRGSAAQDSGLILAFLTKVLRLSEGQLSSVAKTFFPDWSGPKDDPRIAHFVSYRFEAQPIGVFRTAIAISSPTTTRPYLEFESSMIHRDGQVDSRGFVIPMGRATYLIGRLSNGFGLQVFKISSQWLNTTDEHDYVPGLVLSFDNGQVPVAARALLVPVASEDVAKRRRGRADFAKAMKELGPDRVEALRNRIDFDEERNITLAGATVNRDQIKEQTLEALVEFFGDDGFKIMRHGDGQDVEDFNPAASEHYSFNGALQALSIKPQASNRTVGDGDASEPPASGGE